MIVWGVIVFFLPLQAIHEKMTKSIALEQREIAQRLRALTSEEQSGGEATMTDLRAELRKLTAILTLDAERRDLVSVPSWPFDTSIISRFAAILLTVAAIILARYVSIALHI